MRGRFYARNMLCEGVLLRKGRICEGMMLREEHAMPGDDTAPEDDTAH